MPTVAFNLCQLVAVMRLALSWYFPRVKATRRPIKKSNVRRETSGLPLNKPTTERKKERNRSMTLTGCITARESAYVFCPALADRKPLVRVVLLALVEDDIDLPEPLERDSAA